MRIRVGQIIKGLAWLFLFLLGKHLVSQEVPVINPTHQAPNPSGACATVGFSDMNFLAASCAPRGYRIVAGEFSLPGLL